MKTLQQVIAGADRQKAAIRRFNFSGLVALKAVYAAAWEVNVPVETHQQNCRNWGGAQVILPTARSSKAMCELIDGLGHTLHFSELTGVRPMMETYPLEKAAGVMRVC
jgi:fructose/tagatose bisphosphate aldolase